MGTPLMRCQLCDCMCRVDSFEPVEAFPHSIACQWCAAELRADELDAVSGDRNCDCNGGCSRCLGVCSYGGF